MGRSIASQALLGILAAAATVLAPLTPVRAQQPPGGPAPPADVQIQTAPEPKPERAKVVAPPLHYETTRPPDADNYGHDVRVEHDPAFIEPLTGRIDGPTSSAQYGLSGWTSPNTPVGPSVIGYREVNGWIGFGFSIVWGGPPAAARPASLRPAAPAR